MILLRRMPANFTTPLDELPGYPAWLAVVRAYARCQRLMSHELEALGLSVAQHEVLLTIARDEGLSQNDVAARLLVTKSNVTALLTRLERRAHPQRFLTPSARRERSRRLSDADFLHRRYDEGHPGRPSTTAASVPPMLFERGACFSPPPSFRRRLGAVAAGEVARGKHHSSPWFRS